MLQRKIIVPYGRVAGAATVTEENSLVRVVSQAQFANCHLHLLEGAGLMTNLGTLHPVAGPTEERQLTTP